MATEVSVHGVTKTNNLQGNFLVMMKATVSLSVYIRRNCTVFQIVYIIPGDDYIGSWISVSVGGVSTTLIALANPFLAKYVSELTNCYTKYILVELYNVLATVCTIMFWRGGNCPPSIYFIYLIFGHLSLLIFKF